MNPSSFNSVTEIKEAFSPAKMTLGNIPKNVIGAVSEGFVGIATTTFTNTKPGLARDTALGLLHKSYLAQVGTIATHWSGGEAAY